MFSTDQGQTWGELTVVADDRTGKLLWWDQMCSVLPDGRIYTLTWAHRYGTSEDLTTHWVSPLTRDALGPSPSPRTCEPKCARPFRYPMTA